MKKTNVVNTVVSTTLGVILGMSMTALANSYVQAYRNTDISISVNGETKILNDATTGEREYPLTYNNRTYIPLRSVATLLGYHVDYNSATNTAIVNSPDYNIPNTNEKITLDSISASGIAYLDGMYTSTEKPSSLKAIQESNIIADARGVLDTIYCASKDYVPRIHSQSPFQQEYIDMSLLTVAMKDAGMVGAENVNTMYTEGGTILRYVYDKAGKYKGIILTYDIHITYYDNNGKSQSKSIGPITSILLNETADEYKLQLFADIVD